ncbi:MAG: heme exporter protein CcmD [Sutterella seckii]
MNGHGYYVWCAYGAFTAGVIYELWSLITRRRAICRRIMREARARKSRLKNRDPRARKGDQHEFKDQEARSDRRCRGGSRRRHLHGAAGLQ